MSSSVTKPDLSKPLLQEPGQNNPPAPTSSLGPLEHFVGTWTNRKFGHPKRGGKKDPYSFNVMPLPQSYPYSNLGYILKNFSYYEEITFSAIHGTAPNRGGLGTQVANTLFYEQRVYFAEGPDKDKLVHAENGSWLFLTDQQQQIGPYGPDIEPRSRPPMQQFDIVKQISVPHGNSILAGGRAGGPYYGAPNIAPVNPVLPQGIDTTPYTTQSDHSSDYQNPNVAYTLNPNKPLTQAIVADPPSSFIQIDVDTDSTGYSVTNIPFEARKANVTRYFATYWLEAFNGGHQYDQLQYSQTMMMALDINGVSVPFPHVTTNTLRRLE